MISRLVSKPLFVPLFTLATTTVPLLSGMFHVRKVCDEMTSALNERTKQLARILQTPACNENELVSGAVEIDNKTKHKGGIYSSGPYLYPKL